MVDFFKIKILEFFFGSTKDCRDEFSNLKYVLVGDRVDLFEQTRVSI